jgi:hypothetical protein
MGGMMASKLECLEAVILCVAIIMTLALIIIPNTAGCVQSTENKSYNNGRYVTIGGLQYPYEIVEVEGQRFIVILGSGHSIAPLPKKE